jgi:hypothetical protein
MTQGSAMGGMIAMAEGQMGYLSMGWQMGACI